MAPNIFVNLRDEKEVYRRGERVSGDCIIELTEPITAKAVRIYFYGRACVEFEHYEVGVGHAGHVIMPTVKSKTVNSSENYFSYLTTLWGRKVNEAGENSQLLPGSYKWAFAFKIPDRPLPSSFEGEHGSVMYWLKIEIVKPFPRPNVKRYRFVTVLDNLDLNVARYQTPVRGSNSKIVSKVLGFGNAGKLQLTATTDKKGYAPGEIVGISATMTNDSTKDMGLTKAKLIQRGHFYALGCDKSEESTLAVVEGTKLLKGETKQWQWENISLGAIPPTSVSGSCHIITVSYYIRLYIEVPFGFDLHLHLPIVIGSIPRGHKTGVGLASRSNALPLTTYAKCNTGCHEFSPSHADLPNMSYTPMTAFVPRYQFKAPVPGQKVTPAPRRPISVSTNRTSSLPVVNTGCMVIRFSTEKLPEFQSSLKANQSTLEDYGAEFVALTDKVELSVGEFWSVGKSLAVLIFPTLDKARSWVRSTPDVSSSDWLGGADIVLFVMREPQRTDIPQSFCSIHLSKCPRAPSKQEVVEFGKVYTQAMRKARSAFGGRLLVSAASKGYENVRGGMASLPYIYTICQWPSCAVFEKYNMSLQTGESRVAMDAWNQMYCSVSVVTVQSMGVAWLTEEPQDHASNPTVDTSKESDVIDDSAYGYLVIRFPSKNEQDFCKLVKSCIGHLKEKRGRLVALTSQIKNLDGSSGVEKNTLAIFKFHQREDAKCWIKHLTDDKDNVWLGTSDIFVMSANEEIHGESQAFSMSLATNIPKVPVEVRRYVMKEHGTAVKSARLQYGGTSLFRGTLSAEKSERICGDWPPDELTIHCTQWPNSQVYQQYVNAIKSDVEKLKIMVNLVGACSFTTDDVSWMNDEEPEREESEEKNTEDLQEYDIDSPDHTASSAILDTDGDSPDHTASVLGAEGGSDK